MRTILLGLAGLAVAACGEAGGSDQKTYGAKPSERETVELAGGDEPANQEITGTPTGMTGPSGGGEASAPGAPGEMSQNQSRPMQAVQ